MEFYTLVLVPLLERTSFSSTTDYINSPIKTNKNQIIPEKLEGNGILNVHKLHHLIHTQKKHHKYSHYVNSLAYSG